MRRFERNSGSGTRQAGGGDSSKCEFVVDSFRDAALAVNDHDGVGDVQHKIALVLVAGDDEIDRVELECQVVAERSVEAEVGIVLKAEGSKQGSKD